MEGTDKMPKHNPSSVEPVDPWKSLERITASPREQAETVTLTLLIDTRLQVQGSISGKSYVFSGAGTTVDIDKRDVDDLLQKRQGGRQCCGGTEYGNQVFELSEK